MNSKDQYKKYMALLVAEGYTLDPPGYEQLRDWTYLLFQLQYAKNELDVLTEMNAEQYNTGNFQEQFSRFCTAVVTYGRCFGEARSGIASLDADEIFKGKPDLRAVHDRMIEIRNSLFTRTSRDDVMRVTLAARDEPDGKTVVLKRLMELVLPYNDLPHYFDVLTYVEEQTNIKNDQHVRDLETQSGKTITAP